MVLGVSDLADDFFEFLVFDFVFVEDAGGESFDAFESGFAQAAKHVSFSEEIDPAGDGVASGSVDSFAFHCKLGHSENIAGKHFCAC